MKKRQKESVQVLAGALAEAASKAYYEEQDTAGQDLDGILNTFLHKDNDPDRVQLLKEYEAGLPLTGPKGIRKRLGAIDMEFFWPGLFPSLFFTAIP